MVDVSCVIINYNTSGYTIDCIKSIIQNTQSISFEIVVVDNASKQEDYLLLKEYLDSKKYINVKFIRSRINIGFGAGNMLGVQIASSCKYYAFINNDTLQVTSDCLGGLYSFMEENKHVGICSPQMLDEDKNFRVTIDHFSTLGREILKRSNLEKLFPKKYLNRKQTFSKPTKVQYVQGSFMFTNAKVFNELGGFDTNLFLYYEESDLSLRLLREKNLETYICPDFEYIHYKGGSTTKGIAIKIEQKVSLLYHTRKHHGWFQYRVLLSYFIVRYSLTSIIKPKYFKLLLCFLRGAHVSDSLRQKQKIT